MSQGMVAAVHSSGTGVAFANATGTGLRAVGIAKESITASTSGEIHTDGPLTMSDWTSVTGSTNLTAMGRYYLDTTDGKLTTTPPSSSGNLVQLVGVAVSPTTLDLQIGRGIKKA